MFNQSINLPQELPVADKNRKSTDVVCTFLTAILAITIFLVACFSFSRANINKIYYNSSNNVDGSHCESGLFVYDDFTDAASRRCVTSCPSHFSANNGVCIPDDSDLRQKYIDSPAISHGWDYDGFKKTLFFSTIIALSLGLLWLVFVYAIPQYAPLVALVLAIVGVLIVGIFGIFVRNAFTDNHGFLRILGIIICFVLAIIFIAIILVYKNELKLQGALLHYARLFLNENPYNFVYIVVYLILLAGLFSLFTFQHAAFASRHIDTNTHPSFFSWSSSGFWGILNIFEFIWALQFLRDSFNFIISGNAVEWFWNKKGSGSTTVSRLVLKHWGSVVAGSFLNAFFEIPTLIVELLVCHPNTCLSKCGTICHNSCSCFSSFFNLVRSDAYSYINIAGIPYCNAGRECEKVCEHENIFVGSQSPMKHYRFNAHVFLVSLAFILGYLILRVRVVHIGFWNIFTLIVVVYAVVTWFIDILADSAEGLQTSFFVENYTSGGYEYMQNSYPSIRKEIESLNNNKRDGQF